MVFLKEKYISLTNDAWRVVIILDMSAYEEMISTIKGDLPLVEGQRSEFTSISELKQTEALLNTLESRLRHFQQILPMLGRRRGLMSFGYTVLKTLFFTSTVANFHQFHETLMNYNPVTPIFFILCLIR